jgi:serine phosphatase RsbU (regulator of sigma subunit)
VLESVNKTIADMSLENFVTAACCVIDPTTGRAELSLAGHATPLYDASHCSAMACVVRVRLMGLEPMAYGLKVRCSTD